MNRKFTDSRAHGLFALGALLVGCSSSRPEVVSSDLPDGANTPPPPWDDGFDPSKDPWEAGAPDDGGTPFVSGPVRIFAFGSNTCAIVPGNVLKCWGRNTYGLVGNRDPDERDVLEPTVVAGVTPTMVAGGIDHVCVSDGSTVTCWGKNEYGALGRGVSPDGGTDTACKDGKACSLSPAPVPGISGVVQIASGADFSCALLADRTVRCWGKNDLGQLGTLPGSRAFDSCNGAPCSGTPIAVPELANVEQITAGGTAACARKANGEIACWGRLYDFVRNSDRYLAPTTAPTVLPDVRAALDVAMGSGGHLCVVYGTSAVGCMGNNLDLQSLHWSGLWALPEMTPKSAKEAPMGFRRLALGRNHSCGLTNDNTAFCWGASFQAQVRSWCTWQVGDALRLPYLMVSDVSAGLDHTCIARSNGEVYCQGRNDHGQLTGQPTSNCAVSVPDSTPHDVRQVAGLL